MDRIGKYEVLGVLGQGGMGVVYRALDPVIAREVAVKLILGRAIDAPAARERFYREARSAGKLSHENIITIYDVGETDGRPFIVMELLDGADLRRRLDASPPPALDARLDVAAQICRGLDYAHARGVVHRDIKPENVQVLSTGRAKILDFGIARVDAETQTLTQGQIGTPRYMSPEQIRGEPLDHRTDVFSFGVMLYEMLTGVNPFRGEHVTTVIYKVLNETPPPLTAAALGKVSGLGQPANEGGVRALEAVLRGCLEKQPDRRYGSLGEVATAIERAREILRRGDDGPAEPRPSLWGFLRRKGPAPPPSAPRGATPPFGRAHEPAPPRVPSPAAASTAEAALDLTVALPTGAAPAAPPPDAGSDAGLETLPLSAYATAGTPEPGAATVDDLGELGDDLPTATTGDATTTDIDDLEEDAEEHTAEEHAANGTDAAGWEAPDAPGAEAVETLDPPQTDVDVEDGAEATLSEDLPELPVATPVPAPEDRDAFAETVGGVPFPAAYAGDGEPSVQTEGPAAPADSEAAAAPPTAASDDALGPETDEEAAATVAFEPVLPVPAAPFRSPARDEADATQALPSPSTTPPTPAPPPRPAAPSREAASADEAPPRGKPRFPSPLFVIGGLAALVLLGASVAFFAWPSSQSGSDGAGTTVEGPTEERSEELAALEASARQELQRMAVQRDSAAAAGAGDTPAFQLALERARAAEAAFARGDEAGFVEAAEAARDAAGRFTAARLEATVGAEELRERAERASRAAEEARRRVLAHRNDPAAAPLFRRADQALTAARSARDAGDLAEATRLFAEAERGFREARAAVDQQALREEVLRLRGEAQRARDRALPRAAAAPSLFRQADERLSYGMQRLERESYSSARSAFQQAIRLYEQVIATPTAGTNEPTPAGPTEAEATAAMRSLANQLAGYVRAENIGGVQSLHANLGVTWGRFFESFDVVSASASVSGLSVDGERASATVTVSVQFVPTGGAEQQSSNFSYNWTITRSGSRWRIVSVR